MSAASDHSEHVDLHELVDQLSPAQALAVRAVVLQLVASIAPTTQGGAGRPAFIGAGASERGVTPHMDELLADGFGRG